MALMTGQVLQNRYRVVALLGQGGMGAVYRAWDTRLGVAVALKEMTPEPGLDQARLLAAREQFHQEASVLSRLSHPHLVWVSNFFDEGGSTYLVMAFVEGESLAAHISRVGAVNETQVLAWADQLLDALAYCHREGVLHRDIKPQNVILRSDGSVVLVDFGLVKLWNPDDPRTRTVIRSMGTPQYAPPEQYDPQMGHTDPRSDLYSLGATLYHAFTGQVPPTATSRIVSPGTLVPARQYNAGVSNRVEWALERAMALQPDARFQTAEEMRQSLGGASVSRAPETGKTEVMEPGALAPARKFPLGMAGIVIAALLVCVVVGLAVGVTYWITNRDGAATSEVPTPEDEPTSLPLVETPRSTNTPEPKVVPGASPTARPSATPTPIGERAVRATVEASLLSGLSYRRQNGPAIFAYRLEHPPVVDGLLDEWSGESHPVSYLTYEAAPGSWTGAVDLSGYLQVGWDSSYLYVGVRVVDDVHAQNQSGELIFRGDEIEIQFDADLQDDYAATTLSGDDYQIGLSPGNLAGADPQAYIWLPEDLEQQGTMVSLAARKRSDGYVLEAAIPWWVIGDFPGDGKAMGFCLSLSDNDNTTAAEQQTMMSSSPGRTLDDPTTWGTLILANLP